MKLYECKQGQEVFLVTINDGTKIGWVGDRTNGGLSTISYLNAGSKGEGFYDGYLHNDPYRYRIYEEDYILCPVTRVRAHTRPAGQSELEPYSWM